jgi:short-subunit dehydrogenase involved in D-alanine esterification of teichoic acids
MTVEQCWRKFIQKDFQNAFDTVIDIVLKDLKLYSRFGKHFTKQTSSTILNTSTGSAYVVCDQREFWQEDRMG